MSLHRVRGKHEAPRRRRHRRNRRNANYLKFVGITFFLVFACASLSFSLFDGQIAQEEASPKESDDARPITTVDVVDVMTFTTATESIKNAADSITAAHSTQTIALEQGCYESTKPTPNTGLNTDSSSYEARQLIVEEPERENTLYYVMDSGYRFDLPEEYQDYLWKLCVENDIAEHYELLIAQMYHESQFDESVISASNDYGLMQINTCNHEWLSDILGGDDFLDPYTSMEAGVYLMSHFLHKYNDVQKALVCYNRGESAVQNGTYSTNYSEGVIADMALLIEK